MRNPLSQAVLNRHTGAAMSHSLDVAMPACVSADSPPTRPLVKIMARCWILLAALTLGGCAGFDDYYLDDSYPIHEIAEPSCGCGAGPRLAPAPVGSTTAFGAPAAVPQSREPELLR
jgi:hypothetical protein